MKAIYESCEAAAVPAPKEVCAFFDDMPPDPEGVVIPLSSHECVSEWYGTDEVGFQVDLSKLPKDVTVLRFYNSW